MPNPTFIAALDHENTEQPFALFSLVDAITLNEGLQLISATDHHVRFSGAPDLISKFASHFAGRLLIEEDAALSMGDPIPGRSIGAATTTSDGDDKDPTEIVEF